MNCKIYANQCDEPERLVYHCVINTFVNQTLEVCAYAQNILQGFTKIFFFTSNYSIYLFLYILDVGHLVTLVIIAICVCATSSVVH